MLYLFCGVLSAAILAAVCRPLFRKDDTLESAIIEETQWDLLQRKKEVVLGNIQDLDALIRREVSARKNKPGAVQSAVCPSCSSKNPIANKFCAECGAKLKH